MGVGRLAAGPTFLERLLQKDRWIAVAAAVPTWALAVWYWRQQAIDPLTAPALLLDRALQVFTLALIPAAFLFFDARPRLVLSAITFTGAVGFVLGLAITLSGVIRPPHDELAVAVGVLTSVSGAFVAVRYGGRIPELRAFPVRAVAVAGAAAIPLLQLWSGTAFLPSRTEATLTQSTDVVVASATKRDLRLTLNYKATNPTNARVIVIVSRMTICWWRPGETPVLDDEALEDRENCEFYRPINTQSWISPESSLTYAASHVIPRNRPRVTVVARVAYARGDRLRTSNDVIEHEELGPCRSVKAVRLEEESRVKSLAEDPKYLVYADLDADGGLNYYFDPGPDVDCPEDDPTRLAEYFGATDGRQVIDVWAVPPQP